jgi:hypothetical protein
VHAAVQIVCKATGGSALCKVEQLKLTNTQDNSKLTQVNAVIGAVNKMQNISNHFLMTAALCVNFPDDRASQNIYSSKSKYEYSS